MKKLVILTAVLALFAAAASAQSGRNGRQHHRIERGFDNGELTRAERARLERNNALYKKEMRRALRDGRITPAERRRLEAIKRQNSREIYGYKHNSRIRRF